jgi:hypothetical protein
MAHLSFAIVVSKREQRAVLMSVKLLEGMQGRNHAKAQMYFLNME